MKFNKYFFAFLFFALALPFGEVKAQSLPLTTVLRSYPSLDAFWRDYLNLMYQEMYSTIRDQYGEFSTIPDLVSVESIKAFDLAREAMTSRPDCRRFIGPGAIDRFTHWNVRVWSDLPPFSGAVARSQFLGEDVNFYRSFITEADEQSQLWGISIDKWRALITMDALAHMTGQWADDHIPTGIDIGALTFDFHGSNYAILNPSRLQGQARYEREDLNYNLFLALLLKVCLE